jgi:7-carboxy-7-deazaguanine synthase
MKICEIFTSVQGESTYAGLPCTFVRVTGCNLRCTYCDTTYAYEDGEELSIDEIVERVRGAGVSLVELTGGEPLLAEGAHELVSRLLDLGLRVLVETNGSVSIRDIDPRAVLIMDVKTPGSGECGSTDLANIELLKETDEVKFVLTDRKDYEWAREFIDTHGLTERCAVLFSPAFGILEPRELAGWILQDRLDVRLNLQLHKYIVGRDARGV